MKLASLFLLAVLIFAASVPPKVTRVSMAAMEQSLDSRVGRISVDDPFTLLGNTRGVYLDGYGAVFSSEVDLLASAAISPFSGKTYSKEDLALIRRKKERRLVDLKQAMRGMLVSTASSLDNVPANEQIALAVSISYFRWEDSSGLPRQILMQAPRKTLLEAAKGDGAGIDAMLKVQEF